MVKYWYGDNISQKFQLFERYLGGLCLSFGKMTLSYLMNAAHCDC